MEQENVNARAPRLRRGVIVLIALAVLTLIEYLLAIAELPVFLLVIVALLKGGLVLWYFMHIGKVLGMEGDHS